MLVPAGSGVLPGDARSGDGQAEGAAVGGGDADGDAGTAAAGGAAEQADAAAAAPDGPASGTGSAASEPDDAVPPASEPDRAGSARSARSVPEPGSVSPERPTPWPAAREVAAGAAGVLGVRDVGIGEALGQTLAVGLTALVDLPSFDTSAMDGWAVAGPGPWRVGGDEGILAGRGSIAPLADGHAVRIATGARVPPGATAVLRSEHGTVGPHGELQAQRRVTHGQDVRPRGQECQKGDELLPAGTFVTPAVLGLAAACGYDQVRVVPRPRVEVLVLGDELLREGLPHDGRIRDALGPMLGPWLEALGAEVVATRRLGDEASALSGALEASDTDLVLTTGGTAAGPVDHVHPTLRRLGAELLVDGVAVRPGHPMLLARLGDGRHLVGLPGNPLAAVAGLFTLAAPLLRALAGRPAAQPSWAQVAEVVPGHASSTRLVPVVRRSDGWLLPLRFHGPAMLRGLAGADALAVVPPGGLAAGDAAEVLVLPRPGGAP
ncbi:molybdopterin molybdotransferase MoeA [Streptomyces luteosporeus]|uniref:molybdopterin molybdotransferase MoeA n=1 Tax=Streptomyces luteosporeus TaxID=173856 RepID=UPI003CD095F4